MQFSHAIFMGPTILIKVFLLKILENKLIVLPQRKGFGLLPLVSTV